MRCTELFESDDDPGDWQEALDDADTPQDVERILTAAGANKIVFRRSTAEPIYRIDDQVIEWDGTSSYTNVEQIHQWISTAQIEQYYPDYEDRWNAEFWQHPGPLYHATTEENVAGILRHGLNPSNQTRGISNRSVGAAVFTTSDFEDTVMGSYGNVVFEIDTEHLATNPRRPFAAQEPDVVEYELRSALAHQLGIDDYEPDIEGGMSASTVILYGTIPPQYLTQLDG